uniref:Uncharacterized protein n=1 Tax=Anguilla anguilla TaxID=7936 RepID=A0A0E9RWI8_ANGAN
MIWLYTLHYPDYTICIQYSIISQNKMTVYFYI